MWASLSQGFQFLISALFTIYLFILMLRVLLPAVHADYYNPITQFILKATYNLVTPLQKVLPKTGRIDLAAILIFWFFTCLKNWIILGFFLHSSINFVGLSLLGIVQMAELILQFYFFAIIIYVVISWIQPQGNHPFISILMQLVEPALRPVRRTVPPLAGIDFTPLIVILLIQVVNIVIMSPLASFALQFTVGIMR